MANIFQTIKENDLLGTLIHIETLENLNMEDHNGKSVLSNLCVANMDLAVERILTLGADVNHANHLGLCPAHYVSRLGNHKCLKMLLDAGANPSQCASGWKNWTPLHFAAEYNNVVCIDVLLKAGADIDMLDHLGQSAINVVKENGSAESLYLLLKHAETIHQYGLQLYQAMTKKDVLQCFLLLQNDIDVNYCTSLEGTPLLGIACKEGLLHVAERLIALGADINGVSKFGWTPLHFAVRFNQIECLELLLEYGANTDLQEQSGDTPLHVAARNNRLIEASILIEDGINTYIRNERGYTAYNLAPVYYPNSAIASLLHDATQ